MAKDPTSTRWGGGLGRRGEPSDKMDNDDLALLVAGGLAGLVVSVLLLPGAVLAVLLVVVWSRWRLDVRWMAPFVAVPAGVGWGFGVDLTPVGTLAGAPSLAGLADVWAAGWPLLVGGAGVAAAVVTTVRRLRAPGWRDQPEPSVKAAARRGRQTGQLLADTASRDGQVLLGADADTGAPAGLPVASLFRHTLVVGATGTGKTTTVERMIAGAGCGAVIVDLKGDPKLVDRWRRRAAAGGVPFAVWAIDGDTVYDPLADGTVQEQVAKVMSLGVGAESEFYRGHAELLLQLTIRAMHDRGLPVTLGSLHRSLFPAAMRDLGPAVSAEVVGASRERLSALESLRTTIGLLVQSDYGNRLDPTGCDLPAVQLGDALDRGGIVVMSLSAGRFGHVAGRMAEVVLTDVATIAGKRTAAGGGRRAIVWVDEFSAMRPGPLAGMFARVRDAELGLVLSTQDVQDLVRDEPTFLATVAGNVATIVAHKVTFPASAEWIAETVSTVKGWQETTQVATRTGLGTDGDRGVSTGLGSVREVEKFLLHPTRIKHTPDYVAWVCRTDRRPDDGRLQQVRVVPLKLPDEIDLSSYIDGQDGTVDVPRGTEPVTVELGPFVRVDAVPRGADGSESLSGDAASITDADREDLPGDSW